MQKADHTVLRRRSLSFLVLLLLGGISSGQAPPSWRPLESKLPEGLSVWTLENEQPLKAFAVIAEISRPDLELRPLVAGTTDGKEAVSAMARRTGALVAVNASYFKLRAQPCEVVGWLVIAGKTLAPPTATVMRRDSSYEVARASLLWEDRDKLRMGWVRPLGKQVIELSRPVPNKNLRPARRVPEGRSIKQVLHALAAGPMLVHDRKIMVTREQEVLFAGRDARHPRTAVGLRKGAVILMVVEGRSAESRGSTLLQLARMMHEFGVEQAMNLDGGGSSTLAVNGRLVNRPAGRTIERRVPTGLGVFAARPSKKDK